MNNRFARQILMFGEAGQERIESQRVGIVGLGGLGSQVVQALVLAGVRHFAVIDDDRIEETNLNRVVGAFPPDIGRLKVDVAKEHVLRINPEADVDSIPKHLRTEEAFDHLLECSVIFGCVDRDGPRLVLTELAAAYEIPLIDLATEIFPEQNDQPFDFGGRVVLAKPREYCLFCADQIDTELAKEELETAEARALRRAHGYGLGENLPAPAVVALNGVIANLGVMEFLVMVTGIRAPERRLTYKGMRGVVTGSDDAGRADCFTCNYVAGQRERANISRYLLAAQTEETIAESSHAAAWHK
jgi:molybdopterin-synthase adenylyltransferase